MSAKQILARWIVADELFGKKLTSRGAVIDGNAVAARFLPKHVGSSRQPTEWFNGEETTREAKKPR